MKLKNMRKSKYTKIVWYDTVIWWYHLTNCNKKKLMKKYSGKYVKGYNNEINQHSLKII